MSKRMFIIAAISTTGKAIMDSTGESFILPKAFQGAVSVGQTAIAVPRTKTKTRNPQGELVDCTPETANVVTFVGSEINAFKAFNEEQLTVRKAASYLKHQLAAIDSYDWSEAPVADAVSATVNEAVI